jgi:flagellar basal body-associated protein FliL
MICPNCHKEIPDNSSFCPKCGKKIDAQKQVSKPLKIVVLILVIAAAVAAVAAITVNVLVSSSSATSDTNVQEQTSLEGTDTSEVNEGTGNTANSPDGNSNPSSNVDAASNSINANVNSNSSSDQQQATNSAQPTKFYAASVESPSLMETSNDYGLIEVKFSGNALSTEGRMAEGATEQEAKDNLSKGNGAPSIEDQNDPRRLPYNDYSFTFTNNSLLYIPASKMPSSSSSKKIMITGVTIVVAADDSGTVSWVRFSDSNSTSNDVSKMTYAQFNADGYSIMGG